MSFIHLVSASLLGSSQDGVLSSSSCVAVGYPKHLLSEEQLYSLALSLKDERDMEILEVTCTIEPELFEFIVDYMKSDQLGKLEDEDWSCLLTIRDKIDELKSSKESKSHGHCKPRQRC